MTVLAMPDAAFLTRLEHYFAARQKVSQVDSLNVRLERYFTASRQYKRPVEVRMPDVVDHARLSRLLDELAPLLSKARAAGTLINPFAIAGLKRAEVRNAGVLAALWNPALGGDVAIDFFSAFLARLRPASGPLPTHEQLKAGYTVRTEHCVVGETSERIDLTIEGGTFLLGIEIKIGAAEGKDQLKRYVASVAHWGTARGKPGKVIFLAPFSPPDDAPAIPARWGDVVAAARAVLPHLRRDYTINHYLIDSFALHAATFGKK